MRRDAELKIWEETLDDGEHLIPLGDREGPPREKVILRVDYE